MQPATTSTAAAQTSADLSAWLFMTNLIPTGDTAAPRGLILEVPTVRGGRNRETQQTPAGRGCARKAVARRRLRLTARRVEGLAMVT
ncbi:hypothetical protein MINTM002_46710 [Mycobacterium intracellulare]|nr:hypothetical protein MINTM002_46710 [Mycobacterium intracellulare]BCO70088.1 hypothetical protein MINTM007_46990 [Mycobacterium intracellulare]